MKALKLTTLFLAALMLLASCASTYPLAGATGKIGSKVGTASVTRILFFLPSGDAGIVAAAKKAGISTVGTIDQKISFGLFSTTYTTIVTGE